MVLAASCLLIATQSPVVLNYRPTVGETYRYAISSTTQNGDATPLPLKNSTLEFFIQQLVAGQYDVQMTRTQAKSPGEKEQPKVQQSQLKLTNHGRILEIDNPVLPNSNPDIEALLRGWAGVVLPSNPSSIGDTWERKIEVGQIISLEIKKDYPESHHVYGSGAIKTEYKLIGLERDRAIIAGTSTGKVRVTAMGEGFGFTELRIDVQGTSTTVIERATGMELTSESSTITTTKIGTKSSVSKTTIKSKRI